MLFEKVQEEEAFQAKAAQNRANRSERRQHSAGDVDREPATAALAPFTHQVAAPASTGRLTLVSLSAAQDLLSILLGPVPNIH